MRIGTWNLEGRWDSRHRDLLERSDCDVWLLTEVREDVALVGYVGHFSAASAPGRAVRYAAVLTRGAAEPVANLHGASAAVRVGGVVYCSSVLPWRACGAQAPWCGANHAERTAAAVDALMAALPDDPLVWGGDWNHALGGREYAGSAAGRARILEAVERRGLWVPTRALPHRMEGLVSIDHIALPQGVSATAHAVSAVVDGVALSDHDLYLVEGVELELAHRSPAGGGE